MPNQQPDDRLALPINDFCRKVSISRTLAYRLAAAGKLRLVKLGTRTVVPMAEVWRLLGAGDTGGKSSAGFVTWSPSLAALTAAEWATIRRRLTS